MLSPLARALAQLDDPVFLGVVLRSLLLSALSFLALLTGSTWGVERLVGTLVDGPDWWGWLAAALGAVGASLLALWLFVPVALVIATLFMDRIAAAVDRRFYPGLPVPLGASLAVQAWDGLALGLRVLLLHLIGLLLAVVLPGVGLLLGWAIAGWAIGRGLFVGVAMRRMGRTAATALSTPPDRPQITRPEPTCSRISAILVARNSAIVQSPPSPQTWRTKLAISRPPSGVWTTSGWNCSP